MAGFFLPWATWEKLVFLLGCAIVLVIIVGCVKLGYTHWKLRKYMAVAEREKQEQALQRQMSQRQKQPRGQDADVPFGIRAIESGVEVEGVWISRNNSPEPASRDHSPTSTWDHVHRKEPEIDIEKQEGLPVRHLSVSRSSGETVRPPSSDHDQRRSVERSQSARTSRDSSPGARQSKIRLLQHPPLSLSKFNGLPYVARPGSAQRTFNTIDDVYHHADATQHENVDVNQPDDSFDSNGSSKQPSIDSPDVEPIAASAPALLSIQTDIQQRSTDLDLMHSHRLSQAAETGQLTPRARRPGFSGEWVSVALPSPLEKRAISDKGDYFSQPRRRSASPTGRSPPATAPADSSFTSDSHPIAHRRASLPNVMSFAQFCQTSPPLPSPPHPTPAEILAEKHRSFEHFPTQVLRGQGTGFEILKPGTLPPAIPAPREKEKRKSRPPVSMQNDQARGRSRSSSANSGRKLQKRQSDGARSRGSSRSSAGT